MGQPSSMQRKPLAGHPWHSTRPWMATAQHSTARQAQRTTMAHTLSTTMELLGKAVGQSGRIRPASRGRHANMA